MAASLFDPIKLGAIEAPNRIIMAPLTRGRAGPGFVPNELAVEYYRQRASAGLIISEATGISQEGLGWPSAPATISSMTVTVRRPPRPSSSSRWETRAVGWLLMTWCCTRT